MKRCGFVAVLGETNAGKSTLVNQLVGQKVSIVSRKVQTTLNRILGIAIHEDSQIILIDTPGFAFHGHDIESLHKIAWDAFREAPEVLFVVDACKKNFEKSVEILKKIHADKKVSLILNKVDLIHKPKLLEIAAMFNQVRSLENIFMVSALTDSGVGDVKKYLAKIVPEGDWIFAEDEITDLSFETFTAEITREHVYHRVHQEIPYKSKVITTHCENDENGKGVSVYQDIVVESPAHKKILLGQGGGKIKAIGEASRMELMKLFDQKIHLFLNVVVKKQ